MTGGLSTDRIARYARSIRLPGFGLSGQERLAASNVVVIGAGGLGSAVLPLLVSSGIGTITVVDDDVVEASNLPRQTLHTPGDIGRPKIESAAEVLRALDPGCDLRVVGERAHADNIACLLRDADLVVDGSDNFSTRYLIDDAARARGIPVVWGAIHQFGGQVGTSGVGDGPRYRDLFPDPPADDSVDSCEIGGALPSVCAVIGSLMVSETVKVLSGIGTPLSGRVIVHDALRATFRELAYAKQPDTGPPLAPIPMPVTDPQPEGASGPEPSRAVSARDLRELLSRGAAVQILDVREAWETELVALPGSLLVPLAEILSDPARVAQTLGDGEVVVVCHHGIRAQTARAALARVGRTTTVLTGGVDAWAVEVDPDMVRY